MSKTEQDEPKVVESWKTELITQVKVKAKDEREARRRILKVDDIPLLHGSRWNIDKFLRLIGRLPE